MWMASTVIVPLSNVVFSLNFMPGHQPMTLFDVAGLFVIMFGLLLYRFTGQFLAFWERFTGKEVPEDIETEMRARMIGIRAEGRQMRYVGFNQIEALQSLIDTRVWKEQKKALSRSSDQIRGSLLLRLGIPPSPMISLDPAQRRMRGDFTRSPAIVPRSPFASNAGAARSRVSNPSPGGPIPESIQRMPQNRVPATRGPAATGTPTTGRPPVAPK
jgi:hypothetical protein